MSIKDSSLLTPSQVDYWKNPEKKRVQQRAKYKRYPKRIYEIARNWQKKNPKYFSKLVYFCQKIRKAKEAGDLAEMQLLVQAREEYKRAWRAANRPQMDEVDRLKYCEAKRVKKRLNGLISYYRRIGNIEKVNELIEKKNKLS